MRQPPLKRAASYTYSGLTKDLRVAAEMARGGVGVQFCKEPDDLVIS
jgi:hypothetical protein